MKLIRYFCDRCRKEMDEHQFYNQTQEVYTGKYEWRICKDCMPSLLKFMESK